MIQQVNGKVRDQIEIPVEFPREEIIRLAQERPKVKKYLEGRNLKNVVFVPKKLVNFVVS